MINIENKNNSSIFKISHGKTNAINSELIHQLDKSLENTRKDTEVNSIIITGNDKFFSIGFDIPEIVEYSKEQFSDFFRLFNQLCIKLYTFPKPVFAAITGHATAGGCILATCCDYRFIADGRKFMGLNEIKLGVPLPYPSFIILKQIVGTAVTRNITDSGDFFLPDQLLKMGLVDKILPIDNVLSESIKKADILGSHPEKAFSLIKQDRTEAAKGLILEKLQERENIFIDLWYSPAVRKNLYEAAKKF